MAILQGPFRPNRVVSLVDADGPATLYADAGVIDMFGWDKIVFDLNYVTGGGAANLQAYALWWDDGAGAWQQDQDQVINKTAAGKFVLTVDKRSRFCFLKINTLSGTAPQVTVRAALQRTRHT